MCVASYVAFRETGPLRKRPIYGRTKTARKTRHEVGKGRRCDNPAPELERGGPAAEEHLWPRGVSELKRLARHHLAKQRPDHTLQSGALLNGVYLRFAELKDTHWESRAKFFALCAQMMVRSSSITPALATRKNEGKTGPECPWTLC